MKRLFALVVAVLELSTGAALAAPASATTHALTAPAPISGTQVPSARADSVGVLVKFQKPATAAPAAKLLSALDGSTAAPSDAKRGVYSFTAPTGQTDSQYALQLMLQAPGVAYAEPNYVRQPMGYTSPTDPDFTDTTTWYTMDASGTPVGYYPNAKHWWLGEMNAVPAWQIGQGSSFPTHGSADDIKVAVIDTGMYLTHPDLNGGTFVVGKDEFTSYNPSTGTFGPTDNDVTPDSNADPDDASHGTATAAAVGAEINGVGMAGIGYNPKVVCYKVAGPLTTAWGSDPAGTVIILDGAVAKAIYDAVDSGCKVINMSLGGTEPSLVYQDAVTYAHSHGVVVCASVGNDGDTTVNYPAACTYVVGVGALSLSGGSGTTSGTPVRASFSDYAPGVVDLAAPGELFWTADKPGYVASGGGSVAGYQFWAGTSFSSPAVAGAIAYLWRAMPNLSNDEIVNYVQNTATDLGTPGRDDQFGHGLVNMQAAYSRLIADYPMLAKPTVTTPAYAGGHAATVSWNAVSGYNVNYQVFVDGVLRSTQTSTSVVASSLTDGSHTVSVVPTSTRNWNTTSAAQATFREDSIAPAVSNFALGGTTLSWSIAETNPYTVQAYVDTATPAVAAGNTLAPGVLSAGNHTLHVNATDGAGNSSGWVSWGFAVDPTPPTLASVVVTDALSTTVIWPAVPGASSYDYQVDGGSVLSTSGPGFVLSGLTGGVTPIAVRSVIPGRQSAWATATVTDVVVVPATPVVSVPTTASVSSANVSWPPQADAKWYEYRVNGGSAVPISATSFVVSGLQSGTTTVEVRALDNLAQSSWATATVTYVMPTTTTLVLEASPSRLAYPATALTLSGLVSAPSALVTLQSSVNGSTWSPTVVSWTSAAPPVTVAMAASQTRSAYYRLVFLGATGWTPATSNVVFVPYGAQLKTPSAPSIVRHGRRFTASETVSAPARVSAASLTLRFYRRAKSGSKYVWVFKKSVRATGYAAASNGTAYRASVSLAKTGTYRIIASYSGGGVYANATSAARALRVR